DQLFAAFGGNPQQGGLNKFRPPVKQMFTSTLCRTFDTASGKTVSHTADPAPGTIRIYTWLSCTADAKTCMFSPHAPQPSSVQSHLGRHAANSGTGSTQWTGINQHKRPVCPLHLAQGVQAGSAGSDDGNIN